MSLKDLPLPSIASLRAIAALRSPHVAVVRPARIGLGFELAGENHKSLAEVETALGGPGRLSLPYALRWLVDIMTGLGVLYRAVGFVHGELEPEHVLLGADGVGRVVPVVRAHWDRAQARAPEHLHYLAPEKLLGDGLDARCDVYGAGVLLWEAISGQRLFELTELDDIVTRLMSGGIARAEAPEADAWLAPLIDIAERALAVDPQRRFANVAEMKDAIEATCGRYLASAAHMAELYRNPAGRARTALRSVPPEPRRSSMAPRLSPGSTAYTHADGAAPTVRRSLPRLNAFELQDELTKRVDSPELLAEVRRHAQTLLGLPPPPTGDRESSPPEEATLPRGVLPAAIPLITPLPAVPQHFPERVLQQHRTPPQSFSVQAVPTTTLAAAPAQATIPTAAAAPIARVVPAASATPASATPASVAPASTTAPPPPTAPAPLPPPFAAAPRVVPASVAPARQPPAFVAPPSVAPLPARLPASEPPFLRAPVYPHPVAEPSFELLRPRRRRGAIWLALAAVIAVGALAARSWLARLSGGRPPESPTIQNPAEGSRAAGTGGAASGAHAAELAAEPASPAGGSLSSASPRAAQARPRAGGREEHVVIHDTVDPSLMELAHPPQVESPPAVTNTAPAPGPSPAPSPSTKPPSPNDGDYGI